MQNNIDNDSLLKALEYISSHYNYEMESEPELDEKEDLISSLDKFFFDNKWNARRIELELGFSSYHSKSILAFKKEKDSIKACIIKLKGGESSYFYYNDDLKKVKMPLDDESCFESTAFCFYESFPNRKITAKDLIDFSLKGLKNYLPFILVTALVSGMLHLTIPLTVEYATGKILKTSNFYELHYIIFLAISLVISKAILEIVPCLCITIYAHELLERLMAAFYDRVLRLPITFFKGQPSAKLSNILTYLTRIPTDVSYFAAQVHHAFIATFIIIILFHYSVPVTLMVFPLLILYVTVYGIFLKKIKQTRSVASDYLTSFTGWYNQVFKGINVIKANDAEDRFESIRNDKELTLKKLFFDFFVVKKNFWVTVQGGSLVVNFLFILLIGSYYGENFKPNIFIAYQSSLVMLLTSFTKLLEEIRNMYTAIYNLSPLSLFLNELPENEDKKADALEFDGSVKFSRVTFSYSNSERFILDDVSLTINPGEFVAFVGPSGAGKSTIFKLLLGFEKPQKGQILYSHQSLADLNKDSARKQFGVILQNSRVMPTTIRENIAIGTNCTEEEIQEIVKMASLEDVLADLPLGIDTEVNSSVISGGQEQRIMIARALARKPKILMMDEATSALDNITQANISEQIEKLKMTRIVIAHRLSTIIKADRIYVLRDGKIEESGTYHELMANKGFFYNLAQRQTI